jgi:hypothetical protein
VKKKKNGKGTGTFFCLNFTLTKWENPEHHPDDDLDLEQPLSLHIYLPTHMYTSMQPMQKDNILKKKRRYAVPITSSPNFSGIVYHSSSLIH